MRLTTQVAGVGNGHRHFGGARSDRLLPGLTVRHLLALGVIGGYHVPTPVGEGGAAGSAGFSRPWAIPLTAGLGGLLAGLVVFGLAPEAEGHGTDSAIDAFHHNPKAIRARVSAVKIVASALTIGSGGREGPTGQISAGFASLLGRWTNRSTKTTRIAIAAGIRLGHRRNLQRPDRGNGPRSRDPLYRGLRGRGAHSFSGGLRGGLRHFRRLCRLHPAVRLPGVLRVPPQRDRLLPGHRCAWGGSSGGPTPPGSTARPRSSIASPCPGQSSRPWPDLPWAPSVWWSPRCLGPAMAGSSGPWSRPCSPSRSGLCSLLLRPASPPRPFRSVRGDPEGSSGPGW